MKNILHVFSAIIIMTGMANVANAQRVREMRGSGNSSVSRNASRSTGPSFSRESRPAAGSNNNRSYSSGMQRQTPSREMTYRQAPERTSRTERNSSSVQNRNNAQRVFSEPVNRNSSNERLIVSRNNGNNVTRNSYFDRNRAVSRNVYQNNYRN